MIFLNWVKARPQLGLDGAASSISRRSMRRQCCNRMRRQPGGYYVDYWLVTLSFNLTLERAFCSPALLIGLGTVRGHISQVQYWTFIHPITGSLFPNLADYKYIDRLGKYCDRIRNPRRCNVTARYYTITVTSKERPGLNHQTIRLFVQQLGGANNKESIKLRITCLLLENPLVRTNGFTSQRASTWRI